MKKLLLRAIFAAQEVNVVDHEHVEITIAISEVVHIAVLDGSDELVDETIAREIRNARFAVLLQIFLADGLKKMRFAKPNPAMNKQRDLFLPRLSSHGKGGSEWQPIARPRNKILNQIIRIQWQWLIQIIEHAPFGQIVAIKTDCDQPSRDLLRLISESLLALPLAEIQLRNSFDARLDDAVGKLAGNE